MKLHQPARTAGQLRRAGGPLQVDTPMLGLRLAGRASGEVNRTYLSRLETGASYAGLEIIWKLAAVLGSSPPNCSDCQPKKPSATGERPAPVVTTAQLTKALLLGHNSENIKHLSEYLLVFVLSCCSIICAITCSLWHVCILCSSVKPHAATPPAGAD